MPNEQRWSEWLLIMWYIFKERTIKREVWGWRLTVSACEREPNSKSFICDVEMSKRVFIKYHLMLNSVHIIWCSVDDTSRCSSRKQWLLSNNRGFYMTSQK